jgi:hypothetical protein
MSEGPDEKAKANAPAPVGSSRSTARSMGLVPRATRITSCAGTDDGRSSRSADERRVARRVACASSSTCGANLWRRRPSSFQPQVLPTKSQACEAVCREFRCHGRGVVRVKLKRIRSALASRRASATAFGEELCPLTESTTAALAPHRRRRGCAPCDYPDSMLAAERMATKTSVDYQAAHDQDRHASSRR